MKRLDYAKDPGFIAAPEEEKHAYLLAVDPGYAKASPADQKAYLATLTPKPNAPPTVGQKIWDVVAAPGRGVARLGGNMDVWAGVKTPEQAESRVKPYGDILTTLGLTALGGAVGQSVPAFAGMSGTAQAIGAGTGRSLATGGIDALRAKKGESAKEFAQGTLTGGIGEVSSGAINQAMRPLTKGIHINIGSVPAPQAGDAWKRTYEYGNFPGATAPQPMLTSDLLRYIGVKPPAPGGITNSVRSAYDTGLDSLRKYIESEQARGEELRRGQQ